MNRKLLAFFVIGCALIIARVAVGCHALTPAEQAVVASDGVKLSMCATAAHLCKVANRAMDAGVSACWDEYDMCMQAHGFRDGGK